MQIGIIGLGRMGGNIVRRLIRHGHEAVVYDRDQTAVMGVAGEGAAAERAGSRSLCAGLQSRGRFG